MIKVKLYGTTMEFKSVNDVVSYFQEGIDCCYGAERERYCEIVSQAKCGIKDIDSDAPNFGW